MPAAVVGGILAGAGSIGAAAIQSHQASKATDAETQAGQQALGLQRDIYNDSRARLEPYNQAGLQGLGGYMSLLGLNPGTLSTLGQGAQLAGSIMGAKGGGVTGSSANYPLPMGAISDPSKNGGYAGQVGGTATLGSPGNYSNNTAPSYAPTSQPAPMMIFQRSDGTQYRMPASEIATAQRQDPNGKVLGPVNG